MLSYRRYDNSPETEATRVMSAKITSRPVGAGDMMFPIISASGGSRKTSEAGTQPDTPAIPKEDK